MTADDGERSSQMNLSGSKRTTCRGYVWTAIKCTACTIVMPLALFAIILLAFPIRSRAVSGRLRGYPVPLNEDLSVHPVHYDLHITPNFVQQMFVGEVNVVLECTHDTSLITMHSGDLYIKRASLHDASGSNIDVAFAVNEDSELLEFRIVYGYIQSGSTYNLTVAFSGIMRQDEHHLLFMDSYPDAGDPTSTVTAWTFAKLGSARKLFPCFDRATERSTFDVNVIRPRSFVAISSADAIGCNDTAGGDRVLCVFQRTDSISPDQLALVVTNLSSFTQGRVSVWSPGFAGIAELANRIVHVSEKELGVEFPCKTLHLVVLRALNEIVSPKWCVVLLDVKQRICSLTHGYLNMRNNCIVSLARHVVSIWFDAFIVMADDDRWLSATFSVYYVYKVLSVLYPTWGIEDLVAYHVMSSKRFYLEPMPIKHRPQSQKLPFHVNPTILKAFGVLRMYEHMLPSTSFSGCLTQFFRNFAHKTANIEDVLTAIDPSHLLWKNLSTWISEPSYPLVTSRRGNATSLTMQQDRFRDLYNVSYPSTHALPVTVAAQNDLEQEPFFVAWLTAPSQEFQVPATAPGDWILLNADGIGYFRVLYNPVDSSLLTEQLSKNHNVFTPVQRAVLLDDLFYAALSVRISSNHFAEAIKYVQSEDAWLPLMTYLELAANIPYQWQVGWKANNVLDWRRYNEKLCSQTFRGVESLNYGFAKVLLHELLLKHCCTFVKFWCHQQATHY
ncbi:aminopeptidase Q-like [Amblyomma americanum]